MMAPSSKVEMAKIYLLHNIVKFDSSNIGTKYEITRGRELTRHYVHQKQSAAVTKISRAFGASKMRAAVDKNIRRRRAVRKIEKQYRKKLAQYKRPKDTTPIFVHADKIVTAGLLLMNIASS